MLCLAGKDRSDQDAFDTGILDGLGLLVRDLLVDRNDDLSGVRVDYVLECIETGDSLGQGLDDDVLLLVDDCSTYDTVDGSAVFLIDDDIL